MTRNLLEEKLQAIKWQKSIYTKILKEQGDLDGVIEYRLKFLANEEKLVLKELGVPIED